MEEISVVTKMCPDLITFPVGTRTTLCGKKKGKTVNREDLSLENTSLWVAPKTIHGNIWKSEDIVSFYGEWKITRTDTAIRTLHTLFNCYEQFKKIALIFGGEEEGVHKSQPEKNKDITGKV